MAGEFHRRFGRQHILITNRLDRRHAGAELLVDVLGPYPAIPAATATATATGAHAHDAAWFVSDWTATFVME